jgi:hypothetical protein
MWVRWLMRRGHLLLLELVKRCVLNFFFNMCNNFSRFPFCLVLWYCFFCFNS